MKYRFISQKSQINLFMERHKRILECILIYSKKKKKILLTAKLQVKFFKENLWQNINYVKLKRLIF